MNKHFVSGAPIALEDSPNLLQEGDIFELKVGDSVYITLPEHFIYSNSKGVFDKFATTTVTIGEAKNEMETNWLAGKYLVVRTELSGGGTGMGSHDVFSDGWRVVCERLWDEKMGQLNRNLSVSFYQTGDFTAMIKGRKPVGKAIKDWKIEHVV